MLAPNPQISHLTLKNLDKICVQTTTWPIYSPVIWFGLFCQRQQSMSVLKLLAARIWSFNVCEEFRLLSASERRQIISLHAQDARFLWKLHLWVIQSDFFFKWHSLEKTQTCHRTRPELLELPTPSTQKPAALRRHVQSPPQSENKMSEAETLRWVSLPTGSVRRVLLRHLDAAAASVVQPRQIKVPEDENKFKTHKKYLGSIYLPDLNQKERKNSVI